VTWPAKRSVYHPPSPFHLEHSRFPYTADIEQHTSGERILLVGTSVHKGAMPNSPRKSAICPTYHANANRTIKIADLHKQLLPCQMMTVRLLMVLWACLLARVTARPRQARGSPIEVACRGTHLWNKTSPFPETRYAKSARSPYYQIHPWRCPQCLAHRRTGNGEDHVAASLRILWASMRAPQDATQFLARTDGDRPPRPSHVTLGSDT